MFRFLGCVAHMLFRELFDIFHEVDIAHDLEIETPRVVHASLPEIAGFIVLLRVERWVMQILDQKRRLLVESFLHRRGRFGIASGKMPRGG